MEQNVDLSRCNARYYYWHTLQIVPARVAIDEPCPRNSQAGAEAPLPVLLLASSPRLTY